MKKLAKILICSLFVGFIINLISLVIDTGRWYLGIGKYLGFPFTWLHITDTYEIFWMGLFLDFIVWFVVSFSILFFYFRRKK